MAVKAASLGLLAVATLLALAPGAQAAGDFVTVGTGGTFSTSSCPNFAFSGYNTWQPIEAAAGLIGANNNVSQQFDQAVENNLQVVRMFGFSVQQGINDQYSPGVYNESLLVAFDNVIADAGKRNLKLIVALANNWDYNGNMSDCKCWYTNQSKTATNCDDFFTDATCVNDYLLNAKNIMNRMNTVTKIAYNEDPTIMSWDLINEGRCDGGSGSTCTAADIQAWTARVAPARIINKPLVLEEFGKAVGGSTGQSASQQLGYYQLAYAITEGSINSGDNLRGIAFWRWDNVDPQAVLTGFDQEATVTTSGDVFQQVIKPFSGRIAARCASAKATPATSSAGRKLMQTGVPASGSSSSPSPSSSSAPVTNATTASPTTTENSRPSASNNGAPSSGPAAARAASPSSAQGPIALVSGDTSPATALAINSQVTGAACQANLTVS
ncbi:hypothetical protein WJX73_008049 [Symbiochloris irregularis]|uniref:mannan endo-1,4-beta-mannosidase n=1 Tax=Symbiochloris irregularis TaxID=706552 RepID=A0AAW1Q433_9CHLO